MLGSACLRAVLDKSSQASSKELHLACFDKYLEFKCVSTLELYPIKKKLSHVVGYEKFLVKILLIKFLDGNFDG